MVDVALDKAKSKSKLTLKQIIMWWLWIVIVVIGILLCIWLFTRPVSRWSEGNSEINTLLRLGRVLAIQGEEVKLEVADGIKFEIYSNEEELAVEEQEPPLDYGYPTYYYFSIDNAERSTWHIRSGNFDVSVRLSSPHLMRLSIYPSGIGILITSIVAVIVGAVVWLLGAILFFGT